MQLKGLYKAVATGHEFQLPRVSARLTLPRSARLVVLVGTSSTECEVAQFAELSEADTAHWRRPCRDGKVGSKKSLARDKHTG